MHTYLFDACDSLDITRSDASVMISHCIHDPYDNLFFCYVRIKRLEEEVVLFRKSASSAEERLDVIVNDVFKGMRTSMN